MPEFAKNFVEGVSNYTGYKFKTASNKSEVLASAMTLVKFLST